MASVLPWHVIAREGTTVMQIFVWNWNLSGKSSVTWASYLYSIVIHQSPLLTERNILESPKHLHIKHNSANKCALELWVWEQPALLAARYLSILFMGLGLRWREKADMRRHEFKLMAYASITVYKRESSYNIQLWYNNADTPFSSWYLMLDSLNDVLWWMKTYRIFYLRHEATIS